MKNDTEEQRIKKQLLENARKVLKIIDIEKEKEVNKNNE